jgi:alkanesulfonate monooxygenase SsuD/methylene tetrahydromethanopterin reductase-like flavin-dependent oxidoreductase (luciferase family)
MVMSSIRFNQIQPGLEPGEMASRYQATVDMAEYADKHGFAMATLEEHHGTDVGWSPSALITAGLIFGRCPNISITLSALLLPLHDPIRIAEDVAVLDLASGGRFFLIAGLGYRPEEYAMLGKSWADRGKLMDEGIDTLLKAWTGEPFEYRGTTVRVTPKPVTQPHPTLLIGGTSKFSARRAARFGLPLSPADNLPELEAYYYEECAKQGVQGFCAMPPKGVFMMFVHEDPDKAWAELGQYFFNEASLYASWQTPDIKSCVHSHATSIQELRDEGIYRVMTPDECIAYAQEKGDQASFGMHPLVGGMPIDKGWESLTLLAEKVLPQVQ